MMPLSESVLVDDELDGRKDKVMRSQTAREIQVAIERFGWVDILVQNGHFDGDYKNVEGSDPQDWRDIMEVNLFGAPDHRSEHCGERGQLVFELGRESSPRTEMSQCQC